MARCTWVIPIVLGLLLACVTLAMPSGFGHKKEPVPAVKSDMKYIQCEACEKTAEAIHRAVGDLRSALPKWKTLTEIEILDMLEKICLSDAESGEWLAKLDLQEDGERLRVVEMPTVGDCRRECATLTRVCSELVGDHDVDLSELLVRGAELPEVTHVLCRVWSGACSQRAPPLTAPRPDGEDFVPLDEEELRMRRMLANMQQQGMSGEVFDRQSAMEQLEHYEEQLEEYGIDREQLRAGAAGADEL